MGERKSRNIARRCVLPRSARGSPVVKPAPRRSCHNPGSAQPLAAEEEKKTHIAVFLREYERPDAEAGVFLGGYYEDISPTYSHNHAFFVISRSTSFAFKGPAVDVGKIGRELGVWGGPAMSRRQSAGGPATAWHHATS